MNLSRISETVSFASVKDRATDYLKKSGIFTINRMIPVTRWLFFNFNIFFSIVACKRRSHLLQKSLCNGCKALIFVPDLNHSEKPRRNNPLPETGYSCISVHPAPRRLRQNQAVPYPVFPSLALCHHLLCDTGVPGKELFAQLILQTFKLLGKRGLRHMQNLHKPYSFRWYSKSEYHDIHYNH